VTDKPVPKPRPDTEANSSGNSNTEPVSEALDRIETVARMRGQRRPWNEGWAHDHRAEEDDQALWLLTMVDLKTLLLTLFVILVAYAYYEPDRYDGAPGVGVEITRDTPQTALLPPDAMPEQPEQELDDPLRPPEPPLIEEPPKAEPADELDQAADQLRAELAGMDDQVELSVTEGRVNLRIRDNILFDPGAARLSSEGLRLLEELARRLADSDYPISVEGHTDNIPIRTLRFPSNWELSVARATSVLRYLASQGIDEKRLRAVGHADTRPVASNDTPEGRAANRRVDLVVHVRPD